MKRIYYIALCIILLTGCNKTVDLSKEKVNEEEVVVEIPEAIVETTEPTETKAPETIEVDRYFDGFEALITPQTTSDVIGQFLLEAEDQVSSDEADLILEWLLVYQLETIDEMNRLIYQPEYIEALNGAMGGILNPYLIADIDNQEVAKAYQALVDGFLTVVRYEETPVIETNWNALNQLVVGFSEEVKTMLDLNDKLQNSLYGRGDIDFYALAVDAVAVENIIIGKEPSFLTRQLNQLYDRQIGTLFIGPEGNYGTTFIDKDTDLYDTLMQIAKAYPKTKISRLISELDQTQAYDFIDIIDKVNLNNSFGVASDYEIIKDQMITDYGNRTLIEIKMPGTPNQEERINESIKVNRDILNEGLEDDAEYYLNSHAELSTYQYLSLNLYLSYTDDDGEYIYKELYLNYDLNTGQLLSLEDLFLDSYDDFSADLNEISGVEFSKEPKFLLHKNGIYLFSEDVSYVNLTIKDLVPYLPRDVFYR